MTCQIGDLENSKIFLSLGAAKALNDLNISPGVNAPQAKNRSIKILFCTNAAGHIIENNCIRDYNITEINKYKLSTKGGHDAWLVLCPAKVRQGMKRKTDNTNNNFFVGLFGLRKMNVEVLTIVTLKNITIKFTLKNISF